MRKIIALLLLVAFIGLLLLNVGCGKTGYQGTDPKNGPAKKAGGLETQGAPAPTPVPEGGTSAKPPEQAQEGTK